MVTRLDKTDLDTKQLAERCGVHHKTVSGWREDNLGPSYYKIKKYVFYKIKDVEAWEKSLVQTVRIPLTKTR